MFICPEINATDQGTVRGDDTVRVDDGVLGSSILPMTDNFPPSGMD